MTQPDPLHILREALRASGGSESRTPDCLDDDTLAALAEASLDTAARQAALPHLLDCARCRGAVASVARALADPSVAREVRGVERVAPRRRSWLLVPLAAAALLLVLVWPRQAGDGSLTPAHRAPPGVGGGPTPELVAPVGAVAEAAALRWRALPGADRYRATLFDAEGQVLYETELSDTVAPLPDSVSLTAGRTYSWKVDARTGWDRWSASALVQFSIGGSGTP